MSYRDERPLGGRRWQALLHVMNPDGSEQRKLTRLSNRDGSSWSPDGRRIAFVSDPDGNDEVYVINVDGSGTAQPDAQPRAGRTSGLVARREDDRLRQQPRRQPRHLRDERRREPAAEPDPRHRPAGIRIAWSPAQKP